MINYTLVSYTRIERALNEAWAVYGSIQVRMMDKTAVYARSIGNAWHQASLAHDYETTTTPLPEAIALWTSKEMK